MVGRIWKHRWFRRGALLAVALLCVLALRRPKLPGSLGAVAADVRVGMSRDELVTLIRDCDRQREQDDLTRWHFRGQTHDGRKFSVYADWEFKALPPGDQIAWAELDMDDDQGRDLFITLGPGGVVSGIRLESDSVWEEARYALAWGTELSGWPSWKKQGQSLARMLGY